MAQETKDIITVLLQQTPRDRLGTTGAQEVKDHPYFHGLDWNSLLRQKVEFVPNLEDEEDTSYFDSRTDRYSHDVEIDTDDTDETPLLLGFQSCSHRFRKTQTRTRLAEERFDRQDSSGTGSDGSGSTCSAEKSSDLTATPSQEEKTAVQTETPKSVAQHDVKSMTEQLSTPESSQTESEEVSPQVHRRRRAHRDVLPRFSISASTAEAIITEIKLTTDASDASASLDEPDSSVQGLSPPIHHSTPTSSKKSTTSRNVVKSASAYGLSLQIPEIDPASVIMTPQAVQSPGGSSTASSRDTSPCRELSPMINSLKPPIIIRRGPRGLGFALRAIRVYLGDTNVYTLQHLVKEVTEGSPAFEAGLRPGDLITQVRAA